jgi:hypothetical protein
VGDETEGARREAGTGPGDPAAEENREETRPPSLRHDRVPAWETENGPERGDAPAGERSDTPPGEKGGA